MSNTTSGSSLNPIPSTSSSSMVKPEENFQEAEEGDNVITMMDVLEEEKELEDNAFAVLGGSDEKNCTYLRGYVTRQALYACNTCTQASNGEPNGICLACSYHCHEGHDLYELYTKRNFRCDCGNSKMPGNPCNLCPKKNSTNPGNKYNHNFSGLYCTCNRPYPDTENDDEMFQCIVCEDWFHEKHLETEIPEEKGFSEMICGHCMDKLKFLWFYYEDSTRLVKKEDEPELPTASPSNSASTSASTSAASSQEDKKTPDEISPSVNVEDIETEATISSVDLNIDSGIESSCDSIVAPSSVDCKLKKLMSNMLMSPCKGASFWQEGWRSTLCKCNLCLNRYSSLDCSFICNEEDTVQFYEKQGKEKSIQISQYERGLSEINKMDRVKTIEAIHECNIMTEELKNYLKKFAEGKKIVRPEDINEFFQDLRARKRQKVDLNY